MAYDLGDIVTLTLTVKDPDTGALENATSASLVVTLPDATTASVTPTNPTTGSYVGTYTPSQVGRHLIRWVTTGTNAGSYNDVFDVYDNTSLPVVSLTDLKAEVNISATTSDEELRDFLRRATSILEARTGRAFARQTRVDTFDVNKRETTFMLAPPVIAVTSVVLDGTTLADTAYEVNTRTGILELEVSPTETIIGGLVVTYTAGWTQPPPAIKHAVVRQVAHMWENQRTTPGARRNPDEFTPGYLIPNAVTEALAPYMVPGSAS